MAIFLSFKKSFFELKSIRCITTVGVLIAIAVVLDGFGSIRIGDFLKINFTFLPLAVIGMLFGPSVGFISGLAVDVVGYLVNPIGAFIPWLVLITGLEGLIYGLVLYNLKPERTIMQIVRIVVARLLTCGICYLTLNTLALLSYGLINAESFQAAFIARISIQLINFCLGSYMIMMIAIPVKLTYNKIFSQQRKGKKAYE